MMKECDNMLVDSRIDIKESEDMSDKSTIDISTNESLKKNDNCNTIIPVDKY